MHFSIEYDFNIYEINKLYSFLKKNKMHVIGHMLIKYMYI
jgi:hypothetical protein